MVYSIFPNPQYPFPDFTHPICKTEGRILRLGIDKEYAFHSEEAREKHKKTSLIDIVARVCPFLKNIYKICGCFIGYSKEKVYYRANMVRLSPVKTMFIIYLQDLGVMIAGVYAWHTNDTSGYVNGGYVESEFSSWNQ